MRPTEFLVQMQARMGAEEYARFAAADARPVAAGLLVNRLKGPLPELSAFRQEPVPWAADGFYYDPAARPGNWPWHDAGAYYLQEPSAMAPAGLLDVRPGMYWNLPSVMLFSAQYSS